MLQLMGPWIQYKVRVDHVEGLQHILLFYKQSTSVGSPGPHQEIHNTSRSQR